MTTIIELPVDEILTKLGPNGEHWIKGGWKDKDGGMCLHQGIRLCMPESGDAFLVEQVSDREGWGIDYNDAFGTTWAGISEALSSHAEITDVELAETFGPNWQLIRRIVNQAATLTSEQVEALAAAWDAAMPAAGYAAGYAARYAAVRDLIGEHGFTQAHYDLLTGPWRAVFPDFDKE
jgi:hypothetical protein